MDRLDKSRRSWNMGRIKGKNTVPEIQVRSLLHGLGFRFRLHNRALPGKPDIVLRRYATVIFVHGCFWHRHHNCKLCYTPKSNVEFWREKFNRNVERDRKSYAELKKAGWRVIVVWECELSDIQRLSTRLRRLMNHQKSE